MDVVRVRNERAGEPLKAAIEAGSPQNACALVHAGAGVALVDQFSPHSRSGQLAVREVADEPTLQANLVRLGTEPMYCLPETFITRLNGLPRRAGSAITRRTWRRRRPASVARSSA